MKIYLSWIKTLKHYCPNEKVNHWLVAFPELDKEFDISNIDDIFLDSWGYSIRNSWLKLDVKDYVWFLQKHWKKFDVIANMDTWSKEETLANQRLLEQETWLTILPVYHASDFVVKDFALLEEYCEKYDYVWIGWVSWFHWSQETKEKYINFCFKIAMKYKTKLHGFWITVARFLKTYPFYSVDSTSWLAWGKYARICQYENWRLVVKDAKQCRKEWLEIFWPWLAWKRLKLWYEARIKYWDFLDQYWKLRWMEYRNERKNQ